MTVFVMMPFQSGFEPVRGAIALAAKNANVDCVWGDEIGEPGRISDQIAQGVRTSIACIADVTGNDANVMWELGYAQALGKQAIVISQDTNSLCFDIEDQRAIRYDPSNLEQTLIGKMTSQLTRIRRANLPPEDLVGTPGHQRTSSVIAASRLADSPFGFFDLIGRARRRIVTAAQNHYFFLSKRREFRAALRGFLRGPDRQVDIILCDPAATYAVQTWQQVSDPRFGVDLEEAVRFFDELPAWARAEPDVRGSIRIRKVPFVPVSATFVDPDDDGAFVVLVPNAYDDRSRTRPCFVVSRQKNPDIFTHYWSAYAQHVDDVVRRTG